MAVQRWITKRTKKDRAGNPTGTIWRARYVDDLGREHTKHFPTKKAGNAWLDEATAALVDGTHVAPRDGDDTLRAYYQAHRVLQVWESTTLRAVDLAVYEAPFVDLPLRDITPTAIRAWIKQMQARPLAPTTIRTRFNNVRRVLRAAVVDRRIPRDPTVGVALPATRKREAAMTIPTVGEVHALLDQDTYWAPMWAVCAFAGLRLGEAAALQPGDLDFLNRQVHVRRQAQKQPNGGLDVRLPKYRSERVVDVPGELMLMLARHLEVQPHRGWVFGFDRAAHPNTIEHQWRKAKTTAGITRTLRLHDLRHFYASGLIVAGLDVVTVQKALGHASPSVTLNTYAHLWPNSGDRIRAAAGDLWNQTRDYAGTTGPDQAPAEHETGS
jgi:integrase